MLADDIKRAARAGSFFPPFEGVHVFYHIAFSTEQKGIPVSVRVGWVPDGNHSTPNLRGSIIVQRRDVLGLVEDYSLLAIPDGWDLEKHTRLLRKVGLPEEEMKQLKTRADVEEKLIIPGQKAEEERLSAEQMDREFGLAGVSEKEARDLLSLLEQRG